ncbi:MAG: c-type cytochrome, partial [Planctomycetota bacterium]|nr:c-type cytochrome [Planctomycetota bacterium]
VFVYNFFNTRGCATARAGPQTYTRLCSACHTAQSKGGTVGPDLTEASSRLSLSEMIRHTIAPALAIDPQFQIHVVDLVAGGSLFGRIAKEDPQAIYLIENPLALEPPRKIWRKDITRTTKAQLSTMPRGLLNTLKRRQILDLMAYIRADK